MNICKFVPLYASLALMACSSVQTGASDQETLPSASSSRSLDEETDAQPPRQVMRALEPTRILDVQAADRLRRNSGITLQWIGWEKRGDVTVTEDARGFWKITGTQTASEGDPGLASISGIITEIGSDYFIISGRISITDTPDHGRTCHKDGFSRFEVTQNRKYWRLREFEWCDGLTDYVDIYF